MKNRKNQKGIGKGRGGGGGGGGGSRWKTLQALRQHKKWFFKYAGIAYPPSTKKKKTPKKHTHRHTNSEDATNNEKISIMGSGHTWKNKKKRKRKK